LVVRVRVRLKARSSGSTVETVALANSGYEAPSLELVIPSPLADELGLDLADAVEELYEMASGITRVMRAPNALEISVIADEREEGPIVADAVVMDSREVLLSDQAISALR